MDEKSRTFLHSQQTFSCCWFVWDISALHAANGPSMPPVLDALSASCFYRSTLNAFSWKKFKVEQKNPRHHLLFLSNRMNWDAFLLFGGDKAGEKACWWNTWLDQSFFYYVDTDILQKINVVWNHQCAALLSGVIPPENFQMKWGAVKKLSHCRTQTSPLKDTRAQMQAAIPAPQTDISASIQNRLTCWCNALMTHTHTLLQTLKVWISSVSILQIAAAQSWSPAGEMLGFHGNQRELLVLWVRVGFDPTLVSWGCFNTHTQIQRHPCYFCCRFSYLFVCGYGWRRKRRMFPPEGAGGGGETASGRTKWSSKSAQVYHQNEQVVAQLHYG